MSTWLDGFPRDESICGAGGGTAGEGPACGVVHTTEGPPGDRGWDAALSVFRNKMVAPHFMVDPSTRRKVQFIPIDRSAYALVNAAGGVETNRRGHVIQVEVVGFARDMRHLPDDQLEWLAVDFVRPVSEAAGITGPGLRQYDELDGFLLASPTARQRLTFGAWNTFGGWCGHQDVPENSHWDPGALDLPRIVQIAYGTGDDAEMLSKEAQDFIKQENANQDERIVARVTKELGEVRDELHEQEQRHNEKERERDDADKARDEMIGGALASIDERLAALEAKD